MSRRARQRRKQLRSTIRSSRETPRALETSATRAHAYPRVDALLDGGAGLAWKAWLEATLAASCVVLSASGCGTPAQASAPTTAVALLAPMAPAAPHGAKPSEPIATLLPLPPPPPLPENMPPPSTVPTPPHHHPRPPITHHMLGGVMRPPQIQPTPVSGGAPAVDIY